MVGRSPDTSPGSYNNALNNLTLVEGDFTFEYNAVDGADFDLLVNTIATSNILGTIGFIP